MYRFKTQYQGFHQYIDESLHLNGSYYLQSAPISVHYPVKFTGWYNMELIVCSVDIDDRIYIGSDDDGNNDKRNPGEGDNTNKTTRLLQQQQELIHLTPFVSSMAVIRPSVMTMYHSRDYSSAMQGLLKLYSSSTPLFSLSTIVSEALVEIYRSDSPSVSDKLMSLFSSSQTMHSSSMGTDQASVSRKLRQVTSIKTFVSHVEGEISFHNPYGFLPGELYGMLPFEVSCSLLTKPYYDITL